MRGLVDFRLHATTCDPSHFLSLWADSLCRSDEGRRVEVNKALSQYPVPSITYTSTYRVCLPLELVARRLVAIQPADRRGNLSDDAHVITHAG